MPKKKKTKTELCKWATTYKQLYRTYILHYTIYMYIVCMCMGIWVARWAERQMDILLASEWQALHHRVLRRVCNSSREQPQPPTSPLPSPLSVPHMTCWACIWVGQPRGSRGAGGLLTGNYCCSVAGDALSFGRWTWNAINQVDINRLDF